MKSCYRMNERMEKSHTIVSGVSENNCCENMIHISCLADYIDSWSVLQCLTDW